MEATGENSVMNDPSSATNPTSLDKESIGRYGRQLILPEIGVEGQIKLLETKILIIGAGGLGCPAGVYLAAAGIGQLGFVDYDEVELNNLHRQILHTESRVGVCKATSAVQSCHQLNSKVKCVPYHVALNSSNAMDIINEYDIVLDASDNVATRYLLNDACVLAGKPLVSGSALRFEGQLTVYNYEGGPCYRCLYPKPPPPETVTNCSDGGVLGAVPGAIGVLQAIEAMKIALKRPASDTMSQRMLLFDALAATFRTIKLRPKQANCVVCGENPSIKQLIDYEQFCGAKATDKSKQLKLLPDEDRITVHEYKNFISEGKPHVLIDVRVPVQVRICQLPNSSNIPLDDFKLRLDATINRIKSEIDNVMGKLPEGSKVPLVLLCKQGNDSQEATVILKEKLKDFPVSVKDIKGGLKAWANEVDDTFPVY